MTIHTLLTHHLSKGSRISSGCSNFLEDFGFSSESTHLNQNGVGSQRLAAWIHTQTERYVDGVGVGKPILDVGAEIGLAHTRRPGS